MIQEAYVSYEIAQLLKKKGFNERTLYHYTNCDVLQHNIVYNQYKNSEILNAYSAPTHQMACAWLREKYHIFIEIGTSIDLNGDYHFLYTILDKECKYVRRGYTYFEWNYEDALEAALKYVLENLI